MDIMDNALSLHTLPLTINGIEAFLASHWVAGIGKGYAAKITEAFGEKSVEVLRDNPEKVAEIPGIGISRCLEASESLKSITYPLHLLVFLFSCGIGETYISKILGKYRSRTESVVLEDPYSMVEEVWRLSFFIADKVGRALGITQNDPRRLRGALVTAVKHFADQGHLFAHPEEAFEYAAGITDTEKDEVKEALPELIASGRLIVSHGGLYLPVFYKAEKEGADKLMQLAQANVSKLSDSGITETDENGHHYSQEQIAAIQKACEAAVMVLTGGPGTGKTTVLRAIIQVFRENGLKVTLAAPTGRAAKRMTQLTGAPASTIHRLLGYRQGERLKPRDIDTDLLIIDEGSMLEQVLLNHLLDCLKPGTRIIIVGDTNQLPAIGAGDVLRDLIASGKVPVVELKENFRQGEGSLIASGAQAINSGNFPESDLGKDFVIIPEPTVKRIHQRILSLIAYELPEKHGISPFEIQVVTPQQIGPLGARQLNIDLQQRLNPDGPCLRRGATVMRLGDPVMQTSNSRERGVYNGEMGFITEVDETSQTLTVTYTDGHKSTYTRLETSELVLAYATTVHKLQGSEVEYMIFPITMAHKPMLYRNLLYTGVSRATRLCVLVGEEEALRYAIDNNPDSRRNSNFKIRLHHT